MEITKTTAFIEAHNLLLKGKNLFQLNFQL